MEGRSYEQSKGGHVDLERRVARLFETLGYSVRRQDGPGDRGVDLLLEKFDAPFLIRTGVELKYYENSLVPISVVRQSLGSLISNNLDKFAIVTTIGFTEEAKGLAAHSDKIVLLTEAELVKMIPSGKKRIEFERDLKSAGYFRSFFTGLASASEEVYRSTILQGIPKSRIRELIVQSASDEEIFDALATRIPRGKVMETLVTVLEPSDWENIINVVKRVESSNLKQRKGSLRQAYDAAKNESNPQRKGKLLEGFFKDLIVLVPDLRVVGSNIDDGVEEVDIQVRNDNRQRVWQVFADMIFVECKNWSGPVGSDEISKFRVKLQDKSVKAGIFVAINGITGDKGDGAWGAVKNAFKNGYTIVVLDGDDLDEILSCVDITDKVDEKYVRIYQ